MVDLVTLTILLVATVLLYVFLNQNSNYWKARGVPSIPPIPLLGNLRSLLFLEKCVGDFLADVYNATESLGHKMTGLYLFNNKPAIVVRDPELIKNICVKDFQYFTNRMVFCDEETDPVGHNNLFVLEGAKWKFLRRKLSPVFTSGKLKQMFTLIQETANDLLEYLDEVTCENGGKSAVFESKNLMARFTVDIISTCAFGIKANSIKDEKSQFRSFSKKIFETTIRRAIEWRAFFFVHWMVKMFNCVLLEKDSTEFFRRVFKETLAEREERKIFRNDFLDHLITLKNEQRDNPKEVEEDEEEFELKGDFLLAQPVLFFTAGFESTSTVTSMALYEMAVNPHVQEELRTEILNSLKENDGKFTYESVNEMKYLNMVVSETLRMYPPLPFLDRVCMKDYKVPGTDVVIEKGTPLYVPIFKALHYDPDIYPMPEKFDPERFTEENKKLRHPFAYIPFGEGPRMCIGMRFGQVAVKTGLCAILSRYKVEICEKTDIPLLMDNRAIMVSARGGCYLKYTKL